MSRDFEERLAEILDAVDRPGDFSASGSFPAVLPGLEVAGLGPVGLPLTVKQAKELRKLCEQAPYGKGEETLVDTKVRRVWRLKPDDFDLTNPDWKPFLEQLVQKVQRDLGLEKQALESHLYELLLYEKGSFFLPHRDGEKLNRMVATLVVVLPSPFAGGELVVRHEGQERAIDFRDENGPFRVHYAAFYADCEHEVRPLTEGYRLCLVYNLTLKKAKKALAAPRAAEAIAAAAEALRAWPDDGPTKLAVTLEHQYTQEGLTWDALKGVDRAKARVLLDAAAQADCNAYLALLTLHESGSAVDDGGYEYGGYSGRGRYDEYEEDEDDEEAEDEEDVQGDYEMEEVFESDLTAEHWTDPRGGRPEFGLIGVDEDELLDPDALRSVKPEEEFEGYTGNAGMTLDRWYRHAAVVLWPRRNHFAVLCDAGLHSAIPALGQMVKEWRRAGTQQAPALRAGCYAFADLILQRWREALATNPYGYNADSDGVLLAALGELEEIGLVKTYLKEILSTDPSTNPDKELAKVCKKLGWGTLSRELEVVFQSTTNRTLERNAHLLELICLAEPRQPDEWRAACATLGRGILQVLERVDQGGTGNDHWPRHDAAKTLAWLGLAYLASGQAELLERLAVHTLGRPRQYPLAAHLQALKALGPWLKKNANRTSPALVKWLDACADQLEALTAKMPQPFPDLRRPDEVTCKCADCAELKKFLKDPREATHRFTAAQHRRDHLEENIRRHKCDLSCKTQQTGRPYTLVCTKTDASYHAALKKYHEDQEHLAALRALRAGLPTGTLKKQP